MDFISNKEKQVKEMLEAIGIGSIEELLKSIPAKLILSPPSKDDGLSELEGMRLMEQIAAQNTFSHFTSYLGAGAYEHHVPALVSAICAKSEFLTSYTPYQAEASQGLLQAIFEFQSAMCAITDMDVSNGSLYDGATACAEAALMALRCHPDRNKIAASKTLHPHYQAVLEQYLSSHAVHIDWIPMTDQGETDLAAASRMTDLNTAALILAAPNFFGRVEDIKPVIDQAKTSGALAIVSGNPLAYALYASPGELGADIAVGDAQPLGIPLQFGGPYVGYLACRQAWVRQIPGRLVGETVDSKGRRSFVLTMQAREQHVRREKSTSNICTNQALAALASLITLLWYGKEGLHKLALTNYQRAAYLKKGLEGLHGIKVLGKGPWFNEFAVAFRHPLPQVLIHFRKHGIEPGVDLGRFYPSFKECLLVSVTEVKSKEMLDKYIEVAKKLY